MKRIKSIKFYVSVTLGTSQYQSWQPEIYISDKVQSKGTVAEETDRGVVITSKDGKHQTLIPWSNVGHIQYDVVEEASKAKAK